MIRVDGGSSTNESVADTLRQERDSPAVRFQPVRQAVGRDQAGVGILDLSVTFVLAPLHTCVDHGR